jgi:hypothetical protein
MVDAVRHELWTTPAVPAYLAQNLVIAVDERRLDEYPRLARLAAERVGVVRSLVHPEIYEQEKQRRQAAVRRNRWTARSLVRAARRRLRAVVDGR